MSHCLQRHRNICVSLTSQGTSSLISTHLFLPGRRRNRALEVDRAGETSKTTLKSRSSYSGSCVVERNPLRAHTGWGSLRAPSNCLWGLWGRVARGGELDGGGPSLAPPSQGEGSPALGSDVCPWWQTQMLRPLSATGP